MRIPAGAALLVLSSCAVAQHADVPKEQWLLTLKPMMSQHLCTGVGSPFKRTYKGSPESCKADVERLFDVCANDEPSVDLPDTFPSVQLGKWYGQVLGECISAHYQGGESLEAFRDLQRQGLPAPDGSIAALQPTVDATVELTFMAFPDVEDERAKNMIARYSYIARGWWVELRCNLLEPGKRSIFEANVADATVTMRSMLRYEPLKYSPQKHTEIIQMYALRYASANSFFGCRNRASALVTWAYDTAEEWSDVLAQAREQSRSERY